MRQNCYTWISHPPRSSCITTQYFSVATGSPGSCWLSCANGHSPRPIILHRSSAIMLPHPLRRRIFSHWGLQCAASSRAKVCPPCALRGMVCCYCRRMTVSLVYTGHRCWPASIRPWRFNPSAVGRVWRSGPSAWRRAVYRSSSVCLQRSPRWRNCRWISRRRLQ